MAGLKIYQVQIGEDFYFFGSKKAICENLSKEDINITYASLRNVEITESHPFVNKKCTIRLGHLVTVSKKSEE